MSLDLCRALLRSNSYDSDNNSDDEEERMRLRACASDDEDDRMLVARDLRLRSSNISMNIRVIIQFLHKTPASFITQSGSHIYLENGLA